MMHDSCLDGCPFYEVIAKQLKAYFNVPLKLSVFLYFPQVLVFTSSAHCP